MHCCDFVCNLHMKSYLSVEMLSYLSYVLNALFYLKKEQQSMTYICVRALNGQEKHRWAGQIWGSRRHRWELYDDSRSGSAAGKIQQTSAAATPACAHERTDGTGEHAGGHRGDRCS